MAAAEDHIQDLCEEAVCSICLDYLQNPVTIECGHNFCHGCLTRFWGESEKEATCPQCRVAIQQRNVNPNCQLARFVEITQKLSRQARKRKGDPKGDCEKHQEPLKLFCKEDKTPICVVCDRSKEHRDHNVVPVEEASQECKELQEIFAGDHSVEPARVTNVQGGGDSETSAEMPPESGVHREEPFQAQEESEEPFTQEANTSRMLQSLTVAERNALIKRRSERTSVEKMSDKMINNSNNQLDRILEHSRMALEEDKTFHKSFVEDTRAFFSIFREQTDILRELADTVIKNPNRQRGAVVRKRMGMRDRIRELPHGDDDPCTLPSTSGVDVSTPEPQCSLPHGSGVETPRSGLQKNISIPLRNQTSGKLRP